MPYTIFLFSSISIEPSSKQRQRQRQQKTSHLLRLIISLNLCASCQRLEMRTQLETMQIPTQTWPTRRQKFSRSLRLKKKGSGLALWHFAAPGWRAENVKAAMISWKYRLELSAVLYQYCSSSKLMESNK